MGQLPRFTAGRSGANAGETCLDATLGGLDDDVPARQDGGPATDAHEPAPAWPWRRSSPRWASRSSGRPVWRRPRPRRPEHDDRLDVPDQRSGQRDPDDRGHDLHRRPVHHPAAPGHGHHAGGPQPPRGVGPYTGALLPWNPNADKEVLALSASLDGTTIFVGGAFAKIGTAKRLRLAQIDAVTGALLPWAPTSDDQVNTIAVTPTELYIGGDFDIMNGQPRSRPGRRGLLRRAQHDLGRRPPTTGSGSSRPRRTGCPCSSAGTS